SVEDFLGVLVYQADLGSLSWVLPVGISFYTFQSLSYTIDVYRGEMKARKGLAEFTTALAFFPQLVAGPILRAKHILPQFHKLPVPTWDMVRNGFLLITIGLFKKTIADLLAAPAAMAFDGGAVSLLETWTGVLAFAGQIYGDFSGYSDMAIGIALLIGFKIPLNFRLPYFALSPVQFWQRWHISLSTWLRDYLYISLGGKYNRTRNVMITMLLGGLWHGAAWTFVAWGAFHGLIIIATHQLGNSAALAGFAQSQQFFNKLLKWIMTFYLVLIGWVLFRATGMDSAWQIMTQMHGLAGTLPDSGSKALIIFGLVCLALFFMHIMDYFVLNKTQQWMAKWWLFWPTLILIQAICLLIGEPSNAFIYFQF
ncbi:MAG: MBOAT family O-acyltransferase, partial [Marinicella sp.]